MIEIDLLILSVDGLVGSLKRKGWKILNGHITPPPYLSVDSDDCTSHGKEDGGAKHLKISQSEQNRRQNQSILKKIVDKISQSKQNRI